MGIQKSASFCVSACRFKTTSLSLVVATMLYSTSLYAQNVDLNLPAQSLQQSISQLARQANVDIIYVGDILNNKTAPKLQGSLSIEQALQQLLQGTNLTIQKNGDVWSIVPKAITTGEATIQPSNEAVQLPVITVTAGKDRQETEKNYTVKSSSSATKLNLSLKDTPQSVSVITQKQMEDQNLTQAVEVLEQAPGVIVESFGVPGAGQARYYARGFEITNLQIDGIATTSGGLGLNLMGALDTGIFEQVDIVRGSTGLMAGVGDPSASVNFKRKRPTEDVKGSVAVSYGSWDRKRSQFDVSGGLNEDNSIRGRMVAIYSGGGSYIDRVETDNKTLYGIVEADLAKDTTLSVGATYSDQNVKGGTPHGVPVSSMTLTGVYQPKFSRSYNPATQWSYSDTQLFNAFAEIAHQFNDRWKLNLNYGYADLKNDRLWGGIGIGANYIAYYDPENDVANFAWGRAANDGESQNLDLFLSGQFDLFGQTHDVVLGLNGAQNKMKVSRYTDSIGAIVPQSKEVKISEWNNGNVPLPKQLSWLGITAEDFGYPLDAFDFLDNPLNKSSSTGWNDYKEKNTGGYFATRLKPMDWISVILGTRYNKFQRDYDVYFYSYSDSEGNFVPKWIDHQSSHKFKVDGKFIPYAGLIFNLNKDITAYASYASLYQPQTEAAKMFAFDGSYMKPIEGNTMEFGLKSGFFDNALNLGLAVFQMKQDNDACPATLWDVDNNKYITYMDPMGLLAGQHPNIYCDGTTYKGGEFSVYGAVTPNWNIAASYTYTDSKKRGDVSGGEWELKDGKYTKKYDGKNTHDTLSNSYDNPRHLFKLFSNYNLMDKYTIGANFIYRSAVDYGFDGHANNPDEQKNLKALDLDSYMVVDLMGRYKINENLTFGLNIGNVFDKTYRTNWMGSYYGNPRNIVASLRLNY